MNKEYLLQSTLQKPLKKLKKKNQAKPKIPTYHFARFCDQHSAILRAFKITMPQFPSI